MAAEELSTSPWWPPVTTEHGRRRDSKYVRWILCPAVTCADEYYDFPLVSSWESTPAWVRANGLVAAAGGKREQRGYARRVRVRTPLGRGPGSVCPAEARRPGLPPVPQVQ